MATLIKAVKVEDTRVEAPRSDPMKFDPVVDQWIEKPKNQVAPKTDIKAKRKHDTFLAHHEPPMKKFNAIEFDRFPLSQTIGTQIERYKDAVLSNATAALKDYAKLHKKEVSFVALNFFIVNANGQVVTTGKEIGGEIFIRIGMPMKLSSKYRLVTEDSNSEGNGRL